MSHSANILFSFYGRQPAGNNYPGRPPPGAGAGGHSQGMGTDLAQALRGMSFLSAALYSAKRVT